MLMKLTPGELEDWWDPETEDHFVEKAECIVHQYESYTAEQVGMKLNGNANLGENIADNGGVKAAYYGYCELFFFGLFFS